MIYAKPGVGKSMFVMSLGLAVAGGGELLGWKFERPSTVVFWDGEMYVDDLQARAAMLIKTIPGIDPKLAGRNFRLIARQYQDHRSKFPDIADEEGQDTVFKYTEHLGADLIILDNLSTLATSIEDENAAAEFNKIMGLLMKFKQVNKACMLVHHTNKQGESYRGSSKLATTFEVMIHLREQTNVKSREGTAFTLEWSKYRSKREASMVNRDVWLGADKKGTFGWHHEVSKEDRLARMVELLKSLRFSRQRDLADALGISTGTLSKWKTSAIKLGLITQKDWDKYIDAAVEMATADAQEEDPYGLAPGADDDDDDQNQGDF